MQDPFSLSAVSDETRLFNEKLKEQLRDAPKVWTVPISDARLAERTQQSTIPASAHSERAYWTEIPGRGDRLRIRVIPAPTETPKMIYLRFHGGGWMFGAPDLREQMLESISDRLSATIISAEYRLSPEHPFPAAPEDCEDAAIWLCEQQDKMFGGAPLVIGGESAGAHLTVLTLLRLRERFGDCRFSAANLVYGLYDLNGSPSVRNWGDKNLIIDTPTVLWLIDNFAPGMDLKRPDISPLYAELSGLPPAIFSVGTLDPVLDDSLFLYSRWRASGLEAELAIHPGGVHGFYAFDFTLARDAHDRIARFLEKAVNSNT